MTSAALREPAPYKTNTSRENKKEESLLKCRAGLSAYAEPGVVLVFNKGLMSRSLTEKFEAEDYMLSAGPENKKVFRLHYESFLSKEQIDFMNEEDDLLPPIYFESE
jgi:hypothetical protein